MSTPAPAPTDAPVAEEPKPLSDPEIRALVAEVQRASAAEIAALRAKNDALEALQRARIAAALRDRHASLEAAVETHARANRDLNGANAALQRRAQKAEADLVEERARAVRGAAVATPGLTAADIAALKAIAAASVAAKSPAAIEAAIGSGGAGGSPT